tara:strand:+ start:530 stop:736 length:207 start_codon:yes stop_codon:yes gene_type:complete
VLELRLFQLAQRNIFIQKSEQVFLSAPAVFRFAVEHDCHYFTVLQGQRAEPFLVLKVLLPPAGAGGYV